MTIAKWAVVVPAVLAASLAASAQQKFPLRAGEWEISTSLTGSKEPLALRICLNDDMWTKALTQNPKCSIQNLSVTSRAVSYEMDCPMSSIHMKGKVELIFDGKEHMSGKGSIDIIADGKTSNSTTTVDYRWKADACNANDVNIKSAHSQ